LTDYLRLDSSHLTFGEYWRWKPGLTFLFLACRKLLGLPLRPSVAVPAAPSLVEVDPGAQAPELVRALHEAVTACEARGRVLQLWYTVPTIGAHVGLGVGMVSRDRLSVAIAAASQTRDGASRDVVLGLASRVRDGRFLTTGPGKSLFDPPPEVEARTLRGRSYAELLDAHDKLVARRAGDLILFEQAREVILELQGLQLQANMRRGLYVPASAEEVAALEALGGAVEREVSGLLRQERE